jgi:CelD/BcsL family acetyltransferase involved in cellulose biosynthesis
VLVERRAALVRTMMIERLDSIAGAAREWEALAAKVKAPPWLRPDWIEAWVEAFGRGKLEVVVLRRHGELAGIAPLQARAGAILSPTNWHTPEFGLLAEDAAARRELAHGLFERRPRRISLGFLDPDGSGLEECRRVADAMGYRVLMRTLQRSPYVQIGGSLEAYLDRLQRKHMKEVRRRRRLLENLGAVAFSVEDGSERLDELLREGFRVEASGWKGTRGTAIESRPETLRFYTRIAEWAAARDWLRLAFLRLDGQAIAFELMLQVEGVLYDVKQGYDDRYGRYGIGHLLTDHIIEYAFSTGVRRYEFLGAEDPAKRVWARDASERLLFQAFAPTPLGIADRALFAYGRPAAKRALARLRR